MSTYAHIAGAVTLNTHAWAAYTALPSYHWTPTSALHQPQTSPSDDIHVTRDGESTHITFNGQFRNLSRYLNIDLALAAQLGNVTGTIHTWCTDGTNEHHVSRYDDTGTYAGTSDCLTSPVTITRARVTHLTYHHGSSENIDGMLVLTTIPGPVHTVAAHELPHGYKCWCSSDVCRTEPSEPHYHHGGLSDIDQHDLVRVTRGDTPVTEIVTILASTSHIGVLTAGVQHPALTINDLARMCRDGICLTAGIELIRGQLTARIAELIGVDLAVAFTPTWVREQRVDLRETLAGIRALTVAQRRTLEELTHTHPTHDLDTLTQLAADVHATAETRDITHRR